MTLTRIDTTRMDFGWNPDERVAKIAAALQEQRANLRTAPAGSIDEGTAQRNVTDLEQTLKRAEANAAAGQRQTQALEDARKADADAADQRKLNDVTGKLRTAYMMQPGTTAADFEQVLPELLAEHRKAAVLNAPAVREQQLAEAKQRIGRF